MTRISKATAAITLMLAAGPLAGAKAGPASEPPTNCWRALEDIPGPRFVCQHRAWMTEEEKADVARLTLGYLKDARCTVNVDVEAAIVSEAMVANSKIVDIPPQPVTCILETSSGPLTISSTFAPHVEIKDGVAVRATPGLGNITGVNTYLAWPVVAYVNHAPGITGEMARMINAYRSTRSAKEARR